MSWPPTIPPNTRTDATQQAGNHPDDHNLIADALTEIVANAAVAPGLLVQSGYVDNTIPADNNGNHEVTWPVPFSGDPEMIVTPKAGSLTTSTLVTAQVHSTTPTTGLVRLFLGGNPVNPGDTLRFWWLAIGPQ